MKKVLIFSLAYYPRVGGAEIAIKEITERIQSIEFHLITLKFDKSHPDEETISNVTVHRVGLGNDYFSKALFIPRAAAKAISLNREKKFDGLWAMMSYMLLPIVLMRMRGVKIPYALTLQEGDTYQHMFRRLHILPFLPLLTVGFKNASIVQTISNYLAGWARLRGFSGTIEVIPNGVDNSIFAREYSEQERKPIRNMLYKKDNDVFLITTSRLVHKNALDDVIRSLTKLPDNIKFVIVGIGPDEDKLRRLSQDLRVAKRVIFTGHKGYNELPFFLKVSDIFIRPSRSEGMGSSFIEAMAAGLPVIATQEGGIADFLFDEKRNPDMPTTGWAVNTDSPEQIAKAVKDILARPEKVKEVTANAKKMVFEKYDWDIIARDMREKVFTTLFAK